MRLSYDKGNIFPTNNSGPIKIIHTLVGTEICRQRVVQFLETGGIRAVHTTSIRKGTVSDKQKPDKYGPGAIHTMNNGEKIIILAKKGKPYRRVMFLDGSDKQRTVSLDAIYSKRVHRINRELY